MATKTLKSLDKLRSRVTEKNSFDGESPFLTLKDGETATIRFLQEFDDSLPGYDERRGTIYWGDEHVSPKDFKLRAVCTMDSDGKCWACEQVHLPEIGKKWKPRMRFYANVIVRGVDGGEDKVKILAQGFGDKNVGKMLIGFSDEYEGLSGQDFKLSRSGSGMNDTSYMLIPKAPKALSADDLKHEVKDISRYAKYVPYENQADFFNGNAKEEDSTESWVD